MNNAKPELTDFLHVFNLITSQGDKNANGYEYLGIQAAHDFDGYTCYLTYKDLTLTLLFHGRYTFDFEAEDTMATFMKKVNQIITEHQ